MSLLSLHQIAQLCASLPWGTTGGEADYAAIILGLHVSALHTALHTDFRL